MANNCWNIVTIKGEESVLDKLMKLFENYENTDTFIEFGNSFFPEELHIGVKPDSVYGNDYGIRWWDFTVSRYSDNICITGDSAWSPPLTLTEMIAAQYDVEICHEFDEPGMGFAGIYQWKGTELIKSDSMTSVQYNYESEGAEYIVSNYIAYIEDDVYESFEDFINKLEVSVNIDDMEYLRAEYNQQVKEMFDKKKALEELKEIEIHLKNLSMESLANKVIKIHNALEFEWKKELEENEENISISEE